MDRDVIEVELTAEERALILRYGYPFDRLEQSLEACRDSKAVERVPIDTFELERLIGDLSISVNEMKPGRVQDQLGELCDRLEYVERYGVGYLMWDASNLYVAVRVRDDVHQSFTAVTPSGDQLVRGDCVILGLQPARGGSPSQAFAYYVSAAAPGGGSGKHTLFRPADRSGGRQAGHLFRDSSIYDLAVHTEDGTCTYELRIPLSELGLSPTLGTRFGLSAMLIDNDGAREPAARMTWGGGLKPAWSPHRFGVATLVE